MPHDDILGNETERGQGAVEWDSLEIAWRGSPHWEDDIWAKIIKCEGMNSIDIWGKECSK